MGDKQRSNDKYNNKKQKTQDSKQRLLQIVSRLWRGMIPTRHSRPLGLYLPTTIKQFPCLTPMSGWLP